MRGREGGEGREEGGNGKVGGKKKEGKGRKVVLIEQSFVHTTLNPRSADGVVRGERSALLRAPAKEPSTN